MQTETENTRVGSIGNEIRACIHAHARGAITQDALATTLKGLAASTSDGAWEVLSLLDQYHRRSALTDATFNALKQLVTPLAFAGRSGAAVEVNASARAHSRAAEALQNSSEPTRLRGRPHRSPVSEPHERRDHDHRSEPLLVIRDMSAGANHGASTPVANGFADIASSSISAPHSSEPSHADNPLRWTPPRVASSTSNGESLDSGIASSKQIALSHALVPGKVLSDRYTIESALWFGRATAVFRARDKQRLDTPKNFVALKVLLDTSPAAQAQFSHEHKVAQRLSHPQFITAHEMHQDSGLSFFVMELIEGQTLTELLELTPPKRAEAHAIIATLAEALTYLHRQHIAHGDVNPDNIMISSGNDVRLLDFGAANLTGTDHADAEAQPSTASPTLPAYASCERLAGLAAEPADDIYSLSCIAYELLSGHHPFKRMPATQARTSGMSAARITDLTPQQWQSVQRGLNWERGDRIASAEQWLAEFSATHDVKSKQPSRLPEPEPVPAAKAISTPRSQVALVQSHVDKAPSSKPSPPPSVKPSITTPVAALDRARPAARPRSSRRWSIVVAAIVCIGVAVGIGRSYFGTHPQPTSLIANANAPTANVAQASTLDVPSTAAPAHTVIDATTSDDVAPAVTTPAADSSAVAGPVTSIATYNALSTTPAWAENNRLNNESLLQTSAIKTSSPSPAANANATVDKPSSIPAAPAAPTVSVASSAVAKTTQKQPAVIANDKNSKADQSANEAHSKISLSRASYAVSKHSNYAPITIDRENGTAGRATFTWWAESGTAEEGADFMSYGRKTEVLANGKRRITVFVPLLTNPKKTGERVFFINIGNPSNGLATGRVTRAKVVITDN